MGEQGRTIVQKYCWLGRAQTADFAQPGTIGNLVWCRIRIRTAMRRSRQRSGSTRSAGSMHSKATVGSRSHLEMCHISFDLRMKDPGVLCRLQITSPWVKRQLNCIGVLPRPMLPRDQARRIFMIASYPVLIRVVDISRDRESHGDQEDSSESSNKSV